VKWTGNDPLNQAIEALNGLNLIFNSITMPDTPKIDIIREYYAFSTTQKFGLIHQLQKLPFLTLINITWLNWLKEFMENYCFL
jgi:hypothetical protein